MIQVNAKPQDCMVLVDHCFIETYIHHLIASNSIFCCCGRAMSVLFFSFPLFSFSFYARRRSSCISDGAIPAGVWRVGSCLLFVLPPLITLPARSFLVTPNQVTDLFARCLSLCLFGRVWYRYGDRTKLTAEVSGAGIDDVPAV